MIRKATATLLLISLALGTFCFFPAPIFCSKPSLPAISAGSAILIDANTGQVLAAKNEHQRRAIASTTKIMTALLLLEQAKLKDEIAASENAARAGESEVYLAPGEKLTVEQVLYAILLKSANDTCVAAAEHIAGSVESFADLMNKRAKALGAKNTHFVNPHGLTNSDHYSTAFDLALIARQALKNKKFAEIVATKTYTIPWPGRLYNRVLSNHNKLLWHYPGATGVKTGYTRAAGHCLVASAKRGNSHLISVVLGCPDNKSCFDDSTKLLDYGFSAFRPVRIVKKGWACKTIDVPVWIDKKINLVAKRNITVQAGQGVVLRKKFKVKKNLSLPIAKGQRLGEVLIFEDDKLLDKAELLAGRNIRQPSTFERIALFFESIFQ